MAAANKNNWVIENYVPSRRMAENLLDDIGKKVLSECYYFQESENCSKFKTYKNEFKKKKVFGHLSKILGGGMMVILTLATEMMYLNLNQ